MGVPDAHVLEVPADAPLSTTRSQVREAERSGSRIFVRLKRELHAVAASWPAETKTVVVRVGVAGSPWQTVYESPVPLRKLMGRPDSEALTVTWRAEDRDENIPGTEHIVISVAHNIKVSEVRVIAVGNDGVEHLATSLQPIVSRPLHQFTATFSKLRLKDVKTFLLQSRPYEWVEFRNVSLQPGIRPTCKLLWTVRRQRRKCDLARLKLESAERQLKLTQRNTTPEQ